MSSAISQLLRVPLKVPGIALGPDWKKVQEQFIASGRALVPNRGFIATQIVCGGGPKQKDGPIWGRSLRKLGLMDKWKDAKKERIKVAIERQKLERERRAIRRELQLAMEERRRAEHERKLAELARAGIIVEAPQDDRARKEDLISALRTGQPVKEPWQMGLETITMKDIEETFETPINLEALREAGVFDERGVLGEERGQDRRTTPQSPGDNDWGMRPAPREDQVSLDDLRQIFSEGATRAGTSGRAPGRFRSEIEEESEKREREIALAEGITVPEGSDLEEGFEGHWEREGDDSEVESDAESGELEEDRGSPRQGEVASASKLSRAGFETGLRVDREEDGEEDTWGDDEFDVLRDRPAAAYKHAWSDLVDDKQALRNLSRAEDGTVVNPYSGWVRDYTKPKRTKKGKLVPLERRGNSTARIKYLLETAQERQEGGVDAEWQGEEEQELMQAS